MIFQEESWLSFYQDAKKHFNAHFKEVGQFTDKLELNINFDAYEAAYAAGNMSIYCARDEDTMELVGYALFFHGPHQYHADTGCAMSDVFYMDKQYRGEPVKHFIEYIEEMLSHTVDIISWNIHPKKDFSGLLEHLGYEKSMITCSKYVGE